jgi:hypothetical protein
LALTAIYQSCWRLLANAMRNISPFIALIALQSMASAITLGTIDTFESGSQLGWVGGSAPLVVPGGISGSTQVLQITATGRNLATYNQDARWTGNYGTAGVGRIGGWFRNLGPNPVALRLVVFNGSQVRWTSITPLNLAPNSAWTQHAFTVSESELELVLGSESFATTFANIDRIMFRHDPEEPSADGTGVNAQLHLDNIVALAPAQNTINGSIILQNTAGQGIVETLNWTLQSTSQTFTGVLNVLDSGPFGFSIPVPASANPGAYTLSLQGGTFLRKSVNLLYTGNSVSAGSIEAVNGDIDQDNEVGPGDFEAVVAQFGGTGIADCDNDGEVGPSDFELVVNNFGIQGD